jgi:hypothetical protein
MDHQSAEIARPGESPFEFPPILAALRDFGRLFPARFTISAVRNQEANSFASQSDAQFVRIINLIPDEGFGPASGAAATLAGDFNNLQGLFCQLYFPGRCRGNGASQRNSLAVEHHHPLRALALLSFADFGAPFSPGRSWRQGRPPPSPKALMHPTAIGRCARFLTIALVLSSASVAASRCKGWDIVGAGLANMPRYALSTGCLLQPRDCFFRAVSFGSGSLRGQQWCDYGPIFIDKEF